MASKKGRKNGNWRTPEGRLMRCGINLKMKASGNDKLFAVAEFKRLFPDYQQFHKNPVTNGAIRGRADVGVRPGYESEHPDKNPHIAKYMAAAKRIVADDRPVSADEIRAIVATVDTTPTEEAESEGQSATEPEPVQNDDVPRTIGFDTPTDEPAPEETDWRIRWLFKNGYPDLAAELKAGKNPVLPGMPDEDDPYGEEVDQDDPYGEEADEEELAPAANAAELAASDAQPTASVTAMSPPLRVLLGNSGFIPPMRPAGPVYWEPATLMNYGMLVTGDSGSGKTQMLRALIADVVAAGLPVTVLDIKNDYAAADFAGALGLRVYDVDRDGLPFNPLSPVADDRGETQPVRHAHEFSSILKRALRLGDVQAARLKEAVLTAYRKAGTDPQQRYKHADLPAAPGFAAVVTLLQNDPHADNRSLLHRLAPFYDLGLFPEADGVGFADLLGEQAVVDLHRLPGADVMAAVAELLIVRMHGHLLRGDHPHAFRRLVVFDEAHRLAENQRLIALAREGRAFGVGIAIGTQFPGDVPLELSGNLETKVLLRNSEDKHRRANAKMLIGKVQGYGAEQVLKELGRLRQHQALIKNTEMSPHLMVDLMPHYQRQLAAAAD